MGIISSVGINRGVTALPNAPTHDLINVATAVGANLAYFRIGAHPEPAIAVAFTVTFLFAGFACAGDLDLDSSEYRRWGPLRFIWWPYRVIVPHRSWISHGLIMGGLIRALYLAISTTGLCWLGFWIFSRFGPHIDPTMAASNGWNAIVDWSQAHPYVAGSVLCGFVFGGTTHTIADIVYSGVKRRFRRRR